MKGSDKNYVYIIRAGNFIKIGVTNNIKRRMNQIKPYCPLELSLLRLYGPLTRKEAFNFESYLHTCFMSDKMKNEWFRYWREDDIDMYDDLFDEFDFENAEEIIKEETRIKMSAMKDVEAYNKAMKKRIHLFDQLANNDDVYFFMTNMELFDFSIPIYEN